MKSRYFGLLVPSVALAAALLVGSLIAASPAHADSSKSLRMEIQIAGNNTALVRGAEVTAVSSSSIAARTAIGPTSLSWNVIVDGDTDYIGAANLSQVRVGDVINFSGSLATSSLTVHADVVKNTTFKVTKTTVSGTVQSVNQPGSTFVITGEKGTTTIHVASSTSLIRNGVSILFSVLSIGDNVQAHGSLSGNVLTAERITIDSSKAADNRESRFKGIFRFLKDDFRIRFSSR